MPRFVLPCLALALAVIAQAGDDAAIRVALKLKDGSRILGQVNPSPLIVESESVGTVRIPLANVRSVQFAEDRPAASVVLQNGDRIIGQIKHPNIQVTTAFGDVTIPLKVVTVMELLPSGGVTVEWEALPFPKDSDWPGPKGERARIGDEEVVLLGQPVRTRGTFTSPVTVECELVLEGLDTNDGAVWLAFVPEDSPGHLDPRGAVTVALGYQQRDGSGGQLTLEPPDRRQVRLTTEKFNIQPGHPYRLRIELQPRGVKVVLDDGEFESADISAPAGRFYLRVMGWQPGNRWHLRKVSLR